jgi:hypothetical protein
VAPLMVGASFSERLSGRVERIHVTTWAALFILALGAAPVLERVWYDCQLDTTTFAYAALFLA